MKKISDASYNERLFDGGLRGFLHGARYKWFNKRLKQLGCGVDSILELGCFDGKLIEYLEIAPSNYIGFDANWEGGLNIAETKWEKQPQYTFVDCSRPDQMVLNENLQISVCMETLEHVPPEMVDPYLAVLSKRTEEYLFITVPNEIGIVFLAKYAFKSIFGDTQDYSWKEIVYATLGQTDKFERFDHKGFNYNNLVNEVSKHFDVVEVSGHPFTKLPKCFNFGIGIIGRKIVV